MDYYATMGRLGITEIPAPFEEFEAALIACEEARFGRDEAGRKAPDATTEVMASWCPARLAPAPLPRPSTAAARPRSTRPCWTPTATKPRAPASAGWSGESCGCEAVRSGCRPRAERRVTPAGTRRSRAIPSTMASVSSGTFPGPGSGGCAVPHPRRPAGAQARPPA